MPISVQFAAATASMYPAPLSGGVSRPSMKQCTNTSRTPCLLRHLQQRVKMGHSANARRRRCTVPTDAGGCLRACFIASSSAGLREELARRDHQIDARHVHVDHAAGADIQMAHFAIAHLSVRQPDIRSGSVNQRVGILAQQAVVNGLVAPRQSRCPQRPGENPQPSRMVKTRGLVCHAPLLLERLLARDISRSRPVLLRCAAAGCISRCGRCGWPNRS